MRWIAEKLMRVVLLVLIVEVLSASFFITPKSSSQGELTAYNAQQSTLQLPAFLKEQEEKESFPSSVMAVKINIHRTHIRTSHNPKNLEVFFSNRPQRFSLFCSLLI